MAIENPQHEEIEGAGDQEEKAAQSRKQLARMRPGLLRARTTITLETMFGAYLFYGKYGENGRIIGLRHFANSLDKIWKNAPRDPWALWYLQRIETAIDQAQSALELLLQQYTLKLNHQEKFDYKPSFSMKPIHIDIAFAAPLGYRAVKLVVAADDVIKLMLQAHHVDLVRDSEAKQALYKVGNHVRRAFESAMTYREMNVSYKALKKMTAQAQKAIDALGEVPAEILSGEKLPRHVPRVHLSTNKPRTQKALWAEQMAEAFSWSVEESDDAVEINAGTESQQNASSPSGSEWP